MVYTAAAAAECAAFVFSGLWPTPLFGAIRCKDWERALQLLSEDPAAAAVVGSDGSTPLHWAVQGQRRADIVIALLRAHPAAAQTANKWRNLPLHWAARDGASREVVAALLEVHPAAAAAFDGDGALPLHKHSDSVIDMGVIAELLIAFPEAAECVDSKARAGRACRRALDSPDEILAAIAVGALDRRRHALLARWRSRYA